MPEMSSASEMRLCRCETGIISADPPLRATATVAVKYFCKRPDEEFLGPEDFRRAEAVVRKFARKAIDSGIFGDTRMKMIFRETGNTPVVVEHGLPSLISVGMLCVLEDVFSVPSTKDCWGRVDAVVYAEVGSYASRLETGIPQEVASELTPEELAIVRSGRHQVCSHDWLVRGGAGPGIWCRACLTRFGTAPRDYVDCGGLMACSKRAAERKMAQRASELAKADKLVLVLDLDDTLAKKVDIKFEEYQRISAEGHHEMVLLEVDERHGRGPSRDPRPSGVVPFGPDTHVECICVRPGAREFVASLMCLYDIFISSLGSKAHVVGVVNDVLGLGIYIHENNIITRDDYALSPGGPESKHITPLIGPPHMVVVVDDLRTVWPGECDNVVCPEPFSCSPDDDELTRISSILWQIKCFIKNSESGTVDVPTAIHKIRTSLFTGTKIYVGNNTEDSKKRIANTAERCGATVSHDISGCSLAVRSGDMPLDDTLLKFSDAGKICIAPASWLIDCAYSLIVRDINQPKLETF